MKHQRFKPWLWSDCLYIYNFENSSNKTQREADFKDFFRHLRNLEVKMASNASGVNTHAAMSPAVMRDLRDSVHGTRSLDRLSSLDSDKQPNLIFSGSRSGSFVRQRQAAFLRLVHVWCRTTWIFHPSLESVCYSVCLCMFVTVCLIWDLIYTETVEEGRSSITLRYINA